MKNTSLATILIGILAVSAVISVVLCILFVNSTKNTNILKNQVRQIIGTQNAVRALVNDSVEYSKTHHDIEPILEGIGLKPGKSSVPPASKPPTK